MKTATKKTKEQKKKARTVNAGYETVCNVCGTHFDENGICSHHHQQGVSYTV